MSRDEMRDKLAKLMGWTQGENFGMVRWTQTPNGHGLSLHHPILETLDFVASALPEGWEWDVVHTWFPISPRVWKACADKSGNRKTQAQGEGPTEYDARLACCIAAWEQHNKEKA